MAQRQKKKNAAAALPAVSWLMRWSNTALVTLMMPLCFAGTVYLLLFFVLNSSLGPKILHAQLGSFMRGDYYADAMQTDALLRTLTLTNVRLSEAGKPDAIVFAPRVEAKIPMEELADLIADTTLRIGRIHAYNPEVTLDFSQGELNILKVVLPYFSEPEPPEPPGNFVTFLEDLNVSNATVHLIFDGFRIDLNGVYADHYAIRTGGGSLVMTSPKAAENGGKYAVRVASGVLDFNPAMFGFPLSSAGPGDEGLIFAGGNGASGKIGYAYAQSAESLMQIFANIEKAAASDGASEDARRLAEIVSRAAPEAAAAIETRAPRGRLYIDLKDTFVDGFNWQGDTMHIPSMETSIGGGGRLALQNGMMNTAPTQADIDRMTAETGHRPSGILPEESLLWAAQVDLSLNVEDPILRYFFGPILKGEMPFRLMAGMQGDLARVSGDISLDMPEFEAFDIDILRASLRARMDGQHVALSALEAETDFGGIAASGFYEIFDGDFSADLWLGTAPGADAFAYIDPAFGQRLGDGLSPLEFLPDGEIKRFGGTLRSHLRARSSGGVIELSMPEPLSYKLADPIWDISSASMAPISKKSDIILTYADGRITSPAGLLVDLGKDSIRIAPNMSIDFDRPASSAVGIAVHIEDPGIYARYLGFDAQSGPFAADISYGQCGGKACGHIIASTRDVSFMGIDIPAADIDLQIDRSVLKTRKFRIESQLGAINAQLDAGIGPNIIDAPTKAPFKALVRLDDIDLSEIPFEAVKSLGVKGTGSGELRIAGPIGEIRAEAEIVVGDASVYGIDMSQILLNAGYENGRASIPELSIWFADAGNGGAAPEKTGEDPAGDPATENRHHPAGAPDFSLSALTYDIAKNAVVFNVALAPVPPDAFKPFRDLNLPVSGTVGFDLAANIDIDQVLALANGKTVSARRGKSSADATWIEGSIDISDLVYDGLRLGNTQIRFSRSSQYALLRGNIVDLLDLSGFVRTSPKLAASISVDFPNLDVFDALDRIGIDISGLKNSFSLREARVSGSVGFCMRSLDDMQISVLFDDIAMSVWGYPLSLTQPAFLRADLKKMEVGVSQLEFKYRDSVLKLSGSGDIKGNVDLDVNGEIDTAIARSFSDAIEASDGLLGINLSARGNIFDGGRFSLRRMNIEGYLGVRDPIQFKMGVASSPFEISKGFFLIGHDHPLCGKNEICLYTPDAQPLTFGINGQWLELSLFAGSLGYADARLSGKVDVGIARLFVKDIASAQGRIDLDAQASGRFLDKRGALNIDPAQFGIEGHVAVDRPISIELRSLSDPIAVSDGILKIAQGDECPSKKPCIVIPEDRAFSGSAMGGNFRISSEIVRDVLMPKSGYLALTATNLGFRMKDELSLTVSPDLMIAIKDFSNFETIKVSGDIDVADATYKKNFDDGSSNFIKEQILSMFVDSRRRVAAYSPSFLRKMPELGKIQFDVGVSAENSISVDVRIAGATVNLELGTQARLGGTITDIAPTGIFSINSGVFRMKDNDFDFQNGSQIAFSGSLDGKIDITASAEINTESNAFSAVTGNTDLDRRKRISSASSNAASDMYAITLTVGGTLFRPTWSFDSSPYLSDTNIYALILTGKTIDDFSGNDIAMESLLSPIFSSRLDAFVNADQFKFLFSEGAAQFVYVKQITKALRIAAGVSIRGSEGNEQALSGEYYFNDRWYVDLTGQNTSDEEGKAPTFKLGARLHWHLGLD